MSSKNLNKFYGLKIEDEENENISIDLNTNTDLRKLRKKLREIEKLELKPFGLLNSDEIIKLKKKDSIISALNNIYKSNNEPNNEPNLDTPIKLPIQKSFEQLEKEQIEYRQNLMEKKMEKKRIFEDFWRDKYKKYESYSDYPTNKVFNDACKFMNINIKNINKDTLKSQYHKLALIYHPDKGGEHHKMVNLSSSYGIIKKFLELQ